jgi:hypothetical protein
LKLSSTLSSLLDGRPVDKKSVTQLVRRASLNAVPFDLTQEQALVNASNKAERERYTSLSYDENHRASPYTITPVVRGTTKQTKDTETSHGSSRDQNRPDKGSLSSLFRSMDSHITGLDEGEEEESEIANPYGMRSSFSPIPPQDFNFHSPYPQTHTHTPPPPTLSSPSYRLDRNAPFHMYVHGGSGTLFLELGDDMEDMCDTLFNTVHRLSEMKFELQSMNNSSNELISTKNGRSIMI